MRLTRAALALLALTLAALPATAQSTKDALDLVPERTVVYGLVNNPQELNGKVKDLIKSVGIPFGISPLDMIKRELKAQSINDKGSMLFVAVHDGEDIQDATPLLYVPVENYGEFVKSLGGSETDQIGSIDLPNGARCAVSKRGSYAVIAQGNHGKRLEKILKTPTAKVTAGVTQAVASSDLAVVVTQLGIKELSDAARKALKDAKDRDELPPESAAFLKGWMGFFEDFTKSLETDLTNVIVSAKINKDGIFLEKQAFFVENSGFAKFGAKSAMAQQPLAALPKGPYVMAMHGAMSEESMRAMMKLSNDMVAAFNKDNPQAAREKLDKASKDIGGISEMSMIFNVGKGDEPLFSSTLSVMKVKNASEYLKGYTKYLEVYSEVADKSLGGPANLKSRKTTVDGLEAVEITAEIKTNDANPIEERIMELYFGKDRKMMVTSVALDNNTVLLLYRNAEKAEEVIKAYKQNLVPLNSDAPTSKTLSLLSAGSQWTWVMSPNGSIDFANRMMNMFPEANGFQLPAFPASSPVGLGARLNGSGFEARLVIPADMIEKVGRYILQWQQGKGV